MSILDTLQSRIDQARADAERQRTNDEQVRRIRRVGRVLSSFSNLLWTTRGAPAQDFSRMDRLNAEDDARAERRADRLQKAHEAINRLRMTAAKADADHEIAESRIDNEKSRIANDEKRINALIEHQQNQQNNENRKTDAFLQKTDAEIRHLDAKSSLAKTQQEVARQKTWYQPRKPKRLSLKTYRKRKR